MELAITRGRSSNTELAARRRFGKFAPEKEKAVRKIDVKQEDEILVALRKGWKSYNIHTITGEGLRNMLETVIELGYSSKDVEKFSLILAEFQDERDFGPKAGYFLSALIENCKDDDFVIHTDHLVVDICYLGYGNTKNITVKGNGGVLLGCWMQSGSITVEGNAGACAGANLKGGEIHIEGDCGTFANDITGGKIYHKGKLIVDK